MESVGLQKLNIESGNSADVFNCMIFNGESCFSG